MRASRALLWVLPATLLVASCASVLGIRREAPSHPFEHRAHELHGVNCVQCHLGLARAEGQSGLHLPSADRCVGCHQKPHDSRPCLECHGEPWVREGAELAQRQLRFDHARHLPATAGDCVPCHSEMTVAGAEGSLPRMATCFGCHQHRDQWTLRDCDGCHVDLAAEGTLPADHLLHDGDWIREHGTRAASERDLCASCHSERQCASCHAEGTAPALPARLAFDDVRLSGLHRAGFKARHADEARADRGLCTTCHSPDSCVDCHNRENVGAGSSSARSPHPPGWLTPSGGDHGPNARLDPVSCAGCHGGAGEQLCVGCHHVGGPGGNPHGPGFSSHKDAHRDLPCRECHGVGP